MSAKKIVFQGEPGANSHLASRDAYPDHEPVPCATFEDAFAAISTGEAALGMIPIENSVAGRVADIHHLLPDSGLHIVAEHFMPVRHQLLAPKGATLADIKTVESHVHALGQCRKVIRKLGIKPVVAADTAGSAREVAESGDKTRAAIASRLAADIYGLDVQTSVKVHRTVEVGASFEYVKASAFDPVTDTTTDDPLDRLPHNRADGWVRTTPLSWLSAIARVRFTGESIDKGNTTDAYTLVEGSVNAKLSKAYSGVLRVDDALDVRPETRAGYHAAGRVISVMFQGTWE